jgi:uncharacterized protein YqeY
MSIQDQLTEDLKAAMKSGDTLTKDTVRLIRAAIQNAELGSSNPLDEQGASVVLGKMAKQYRDSITTYSDAGRDDLVTKEQSELGVLLRYLPEQMSEDEVRVIVTAVAGEVGVTGPGDKGKLMGKLMPQVKGKADGSVVNSVVTELLESLSS